MKKINALILMILLAVPASMACTSAIVSGELTENGRPLLWKNRDTGELNNKIERVAARKGEYEFVALFNSPDLNNSEAWIGYNIKGFAIMNTASYNLKDDDVKDMDKEGLVMAIALKKCVTVDDFEELLKTLPRPMGVEANFGVIDAYGNGAYFETNNHSYTKFDLKDATDGILVRTNYSYSSDDVDGAYGYIREQNAKDILAPYVASKSVTPAVFTEEVSKRFYHSLIGRDYADGVERWIVDQDFIPRRSSSASVVIEGVNSVEDVDLTTMWVGMGYPPVAELHPVWLWKDKSASMDSELAADTETYRSKVCDRAMERKEKAFP
ncbi:MAG: hypothetical protein R3Y22_10040, partial [Bacteroidales bacterium]